MSNRLVDKIIKGWLCFRQSFCDYSEKTHLWWLVKKYSWMEYVARSLFVSMKSLFFDRTETLFSNLLKTIFSSFYVESVWQSFVATTTSITMNVAGVLWILDSRDHHCKSFLTATDLCQIMQTLYDCNQCDQTLDLKSCPNVSKSCLNNIHSNFYINWPFSNVNNFWATFVSEFVVKELSKIAQSDHIDCRVNCTQGKFLVWIDSGSIKLRF